MEFTPEQGQVQSTAIAARQRQARAALSPEQLALPSHLNSLRYPLTSTAQLDANAA